MEITRQSRIILALTASQASAKAFSSSWIDKFHSINYYSSNLTAPAFNATEPIEDLMDMNLTEQNFNTSNFIEGIIGIDSVQRQLECCGVEGSHEWLSLYSGTFAHHKILCSFLIGAIFVQLILSPLIYFLVEGRRRIERILYISRWKRQLEVLLEQQRKNVAEQKDTN
ncbi:unnamed protein product [Acanthocheilonema viteae]|uniref:Uncharacterized protein n=1 Tax=Acanthocheilonema viteae TaxID=6277 RepID=A0A498SMR6_ACAVI|nr:unnamed protein product [Acanthocheilonema viteae]